MLCSSENVCFGARTFKKFRFCPRRLTFFREIWKLEQHAAEEDFNETRRADVWEIFIERMRVILFLLTLFIVFTRKRIFDAQRGRIRAFVRWGLIFLFNDISELLGTEISML